MRAGVCSGGGRRGCRSGPVPVLEAEAEGEAGSRLIRMLLLQRLLSTRLARCLRCPCPTAMQTEGAPLMSVAAS